jgi:hypothetical protein
MYSHLLQRTTETVSYSVGKEIFKLERTVGVPRLRMWPVARDTSPYRDRQTTVVVDRSAQASPWGTTIASLIRCESHFLIVLLILMLRTRL